MNRKLALAALALAGCAGSQPFSRPPESQIHVDAAYVADPTAPPRLAVVLGSVAVADSGGVARHLGGTPAEAAATYQAFFADQLAARLFNDAHVDETRVLDPAAYERAGAGPRPADGTRLAFSGFEPDLVLVLDTLHVGRSSYFRMGGMTGPNTKETLRLDTDVVLWDNRDGREVASGRLEVEEEVGSLTSLAGRGLYERVVGEFVEQLARHTPVDLRKERQRRARRS